MEQVKINVSDHQTAELVKEALRCAWCTWDVEAESYPGFRAMADRLQAVLESNGFSR